MFSQDQFFLSSPVLAGKYDKLEDGQKRISPHSKRTPMNTSTPGNQFPVGPNRRKRHEGFSLVEIILALGIVAFAVIPLMALLPAGATAARSSIDDVAFTQITKAVQSELQQTPYDQIKTGVGEGAAYEYHYYFDSEGTRVEASDPARLFDAGIKVREDMRAAGPMGDQSIATSTNQSLKRTIIEIVRNPGRVANPFQGNASVTRKFTYISRREVSDADRNGKLP